MSLFDGYEFESPFLNEALSSSGYSTSTGVDEEEDRGYVKGERNFASNILSGFYRGVGQVSSLIGKGADLETLKDVGSFIEGSEFAKPDEAEYFKTEGEGRSFARDVAQGIPLTGALAGAAIGGTALAGPLGGAAAFGAVATPLGLGIRDEAIDTYFKSNPYGSVEDAEDYGTLTALAEVFTETAGAAVDYATFKFGGKLTKQALRAGMKSGLIDVDTVVGSIVKRTGAAEFVGKMGFGSAMEGNEEVLNAYLQQATDKTYNVESEEPDYFRTFLLGAVTAAPFNVAGNYVAKKSQDKIRDNLEKGLTSEDVEQRKYTADQIYATMKVASPEAAEAWKDYVDYNVDSGPLALDNKVLDGYKWKLNVRKAEEAGIINQIIQKPEVILEEAGIPVESTTVASPTDVYSTPVSGTVSNDPYGLSPVEPSGPAGPKPNTDIANRDTPKIAEDTVRQVPSDRASFAFNSMSTVGDIVDVKSDAYWKKPGEVTRNINAARAIAEDTKARETLEDNNIPISEVETAAPITPPAPVAKQKQTLAQKQSAKKAAAQQTVTPEIQQTVAPTVQETVAPTAQGVPTSVTTLPDGTTVKVTKKASGVATTKSSMTGAEVSVAEEVANIDEDLRNPETSDAEAVALTEKKEELIKQTAIVTDTVVPTGPANQVNAAGIQTTVVYDPKGWKLHPLAKNFRGDKGQKASVYINGNAIISRKSAEKVEKGQKKAEKWEAFQVAEDREQVSLGTFTSKSDAIKALAEGKSSDEFYPAETEKVAKSALASLSSDQVAQLEGSGYKQIIDKAASRLGIANDPEAFAAGQEGAALAIQSYKPDGKTNLKSWIYTQAYGKIKDYIKSLPKQEVQETLEEGKTEGVISSATKRDLQDVIVPAEQVAEVKEPPPPILSMKEIFKKHGVSAEKQQGYVKQLLDKKLTLEQLDQKLEAERALDGAKVSGKERLDVIRDVKDGKLTVDEVKEAYTKEDPTAPEEEIQPAPTTILRRNTPVEPVAEEPTVTAETSAKRTFLDSATTAEDLFKFPEAFTVDSRLKGLRDFLQKVAGSKLRDIKVYEQSEFATRHPEAYSTQVAQYGQLPTHFAFNKEIYISKQYESTSKPNAIFKLILHETVHALTAQGMRGNQQLKSAMQSLLDKVRKNLLTPEQLQLMRNKYQYSASKINANIQEFNSEFPGLSVRTAYGLSNIDEFVAEVFNNEEMFNLLNTMPTGTRSGMLRTLFDNFVNAIRNFLGLPVNQQSVLADVISVAVETMSPVASAREQLLDINPAAEVVEKPVDRNKQLRTLMSNDTKGKPKEILKDYANRLKRFAKDTIIGVTTRLNEINPLLQSFVRKFEFKILDYNKKYHDEIRDFIDLFRGIKSREDQLWLSFLLKNTDPEDVILRDKILKDNKMTEAFAKVEKVLEDIYIRKGKVGLNTYEAFAYYFPRSISSENVSKLMKAVRERKALDRGETLDGEFNDITVLIESLGPEATEADIEQAITSMINTGRRPTIALLKPSSSKQRKIIRVSSEWNHLYDDPIESLITHIYESNEAIEARVMFGDVRRKALVTEDATLRKQLDTEEMSDKSRAKLVARVSEIEMLLENYKDDEWKDGISSFMAREGINLPEDQAREVVDLIRGRLTQKGMRGPMAAVRNIALMTALGGGLSAVTQLGDVMLSVAVNGEKATLKGIFGDKIITPRDLDLSHSMREFQSAGSTAKMLDSVLKVVQLTRVDVFGKTVFMNAAISKAKGQTIDQFRSEWGEALGKETEDTYKEIQSGEKTEKVRFFAFNALSESQPVSMSEMPLAYLGAGNYRIFYALKSYNIKILNMVYKKATTSWKEAKTPAQRAMAAKDVGKLLLLLVLGGATADELKDFLMQRDVDFSDNLMNNLFKMSFINRYHMEAAGEKAAMKTFLTDLLVPPTSVADDAFADLYSFVDDEEGTTYKLLKDLPFGRLLYNSGTDQGKAQGFKSLKTRVFEKVKDGASMSEVRKDMVAYNRWAAANGETAISYTSLKNAKKKALKN